MTAFFQDFITDWLDEEPYEDRTKEDICAIVVAGKVPSASIAELGKIAQEVIATGIPNVLANLDDLTVVLAHGAAIGAYEWGKPAKMVGCCISKCSYE